MDKPPVVGAKQGVRPDRPTPLGIQPDRPPAVAVVAQAVGLLSLTKDAEGAVTAAKVVSKGDHNLVGDKNLRQDVTLVCNVVLDENGKKLAVQEMPPENRHFFRRRKRPSFACHGQSIQWLPLYYPATRLCPIPSEA